MCQEKSIVKIQEKDAETLAIPRFVEADCPNAYSVGTFEFAISLDSDLSVEIDTRGDCGQAV